ncbi:hypothetical protein ACHAXT_008654 [Thalassiosira profunda]
MPIDTGAGGCKLGVARRELAEHLGGISHQLRDRHGVTFTSPAIETLHAAPPSHIHARDDSQAGCDAKGSEFGEGEAYRCKCTFQIVAASLLNADGAGDGNEQSTTDPGGRLIYVTREGGDLCPLPNGVFPPANVRIRSAMKDLMGCLNRPSDKSNNSTAYAFGRLRNNLTSATFITSWGDGDCLVTLHYGPPGLPMSADSQQEWREEARTLCVECGFTSVTGRSKGTRMSVHNSIRDGSCNKHVDDELEEEGIIHDDLWLTLQEAHSSERVVEVEKVSLLPPLSPQPEESGETLVVIHNQPKHVKIQYQKPATAFQHPNAGVMLSSLHWILNALSRIAKEVDGRRKPRLLEMYCGCGAHTVPLAKSTLLSEIVAVELDERLVNACRHNCQLNDCLRLDDASLAGGGASVQAFKGDAAEWAKKTLRAAQNNCSQNGSNNNFDILLVDPPRDGLSPTVCDMALQGTFRHVLYVSCGRRALLRDLSILCCDERGFDVAELAIIDLFPGTDAVESLVHLRRR